MTSSAVGGRDARMRGMLRRLDVDILELAYAKAGTTYGAARQTCLQCVNTHVCERWLESRIEGRPLFCPNLDRFERFSTY